MPSLKEVRENWLLYSALAASWIISAVFALVGQIIPSMSDTQDHYAEMVITARERELEAQAKLDSLKHAEIDEIENLLQQIVDSYETPSWVKYLDFADHRFYFVVVNRKYHEVYGTPWLPRGMTDLELYAHRDLTQEQRATILEYQFHDRRAIQVGVGNCIRIKEWSYPLTEPPAHRYFKKCMLKYKNTAYVLGYQLDFMEIIED